MINVAFDFIPQGAVIVVSDDGQYFIYDDNRNDIKKWDSNNTIILDTGNKLHPGIIDHHQPGSESGSVASVISIDAHKYLGHLIGKKEITIVTHHNPDFDAIASCYLTKKFLTNQALNDLDALFATYVNEVDSGKITMDPRFPLSIASIINAINHEFKDEHFSQKNIKILNEGLRFIEEVYRLLESDQNLWGESFLVNMEGFEIYWNTIKNDVDEYQKDFRERSETDTLYLLNRETNVLDLVDFILTKNPQSFLWKYWARGDTLNSPNGDGFIFTCALYDIEDKKRAIIANDPTTPYNLQGLGVLLDSMEIKSLIKAGESIEDLIKEKRDGFCRNNPWYDGRGGHNYTIIDAPRGFSKLTGDEILMTIKANELWLKIGDEINKRTFDILNFDATKELPSPLYYENIEEKSINNFIAADLETKETLLPDLEDALTNLQQLAPLSDFEKLKRDNIRTKLFQDFVNYYNLLPQKYKKTVAKKITELLINKFPSQYLINWILNTYKLTEVVLNSALQRALVALPTNEKFIFLLNVQDKHGFYSIESKETTIDDENTIEEIRAVYNTFNIPKTSLQELEDTPLFLFENSFYHFEDILACLALAEGKEIGGTLPKIPLSTDGLTIENIETFHKEVKKSIKTHIIDHWFGENYLQLRDKRNKLLNARNTKGLDIVKRYNVTRISELSYLELKDLIDIMFLEIDSINEEVIAYKKRLQFLLSIRQFESLLDRYTVFLRLRAACDKFDQDHQVPYYLKSKPDIIHFLILLKHLFQTSTGFIWHDDKKVTIEEIKDTISKINHLKTLKLTIPGLDILINHLYSFYCKLLEELEIDLFEFTLKIEICFTQHSSLNNNGSLMSAISNMPSYFRHILYEVLLTYRKYYQEKISILQSELQSVVESDSSSNVDNNLYVDFCNDILLRSIFHDWKKYRQQVFSENNSETKKIFFIKYFQWQKLTNGRYLEKMEDQKKEITKLNSGIRFAAGKEVTDINKIVQRMPYGEKNFDLHDHLNRLIFHKNYINESSSVPLNLYYDTYDYLSERYIDAFDIENVAKSISSFSTKFPAYVRWFSNTNFLRIFVLVFVLLLFLMGVFDPNIYEYNGEGYRPPLPEMAFRILGDKLFGLISGTLLAFWTTFVGTAFLVPVVFVLYKLVLSSYEKFQTGEANTLQFIKSIKKIEGKQSRLLYLAFIIPLMLIVIQMANPGTLAMIAEFKGLRLLSSVVIIFMLTVYSIYLDIEQKNPKKPLSWILSRTKHMFWLYSLQALVLTVFIIDFLLRFQLTSEDFNTPDDLISLGISRYIVLEFKWFDIVLMPLFTIIITFLTLFFTFFVNRIFRR
jgi:hypothetical protein